MCRDLTEVFQNAGIDEKDIDYILPHQANTRIIEAAQNRLKIAKEKYLVNAGNYGNISSASIPILLDEANRAGKFKKGDLLAFSAFGGELTSGACVIEWSK
ncbi:3-oxoacyl-[acyl-carrier-protein] synthase 3 [bioreactor metagenome]|uniref:3-oxoacyl-[acyl-carrier-protein] synthase 3 n=1 Tax=bioreactor metagenome TaxID=1076179 RepID=A0A645G706_9ZZZZ